MKIAYTSKTAVFGLATVSALALLIALIAEKHYGYAPCELCLVQRWWHCAVIAVALLAIPLPRYRLLLSLQSVALMGCLAVSLFHVGVEQHWWAGSRACEAVSDSATTTQDLLQQILSSPTVRCDEPRWFLFGLSMAAYDAVLTAFMSLFALVTLARRR